MRCAAVRDNLMAYVSGELTPEQNDAIRNHLSACEVCRKHLQTADEASDALAMLAVGEDAPDLVAAVRLRLEQRRSRWLGRHAFRLAAAVLTVTMLIAAGTALFNMQDKGKPRDQKTARVPVTRQIREAQTPGQSRPVRPVSVDTKKTVAIPRVSHKPDHIVKMHNPRPSVKRAEKPIVVAKLPSERWFYHGRSDMDGDDYSVGYRVMRPDESQFGIETQEDFTLGLEDKERLTPQLSVPEENLAYVPDGRSYEWKTWDYHDWPEGIQTGEGISAPKTLGNYFFGQQYNDQQSPQMFKELQEARLGQLAFYISEISSGKSRLLNGRGSSAMPQGYVARRAEWGDLTVISAYNVSSPISSKLEGIGDSTIFGAIRILVPASSPPADSKEPAQKKRQKAEPGVYLLAYKGQESDEETQSGTVALIRVSVTGEGRVKLNEVLTVPAKRYTRPAHIIYSGRDWYGVRVQFNDEVAGRAAITLAIPDFDRPYRSYSFQLDLQVIIV